MTGYTSVKVPKILSVKAQPILEREGYRSFSEFVLDSTRRRLEEIKKRTTITQESQS